MKDLLEPSLNLNFEHYRHVEEPPQLLDARFWGPDDMEKPEPRQGDDCLVFDGGMYYQAVVSDVQAEKKTFEALLVDRGVYMDNMHFCRYRPVS